MPSASGYSKPTKTRPRLHVCFVVAAIAGCATEPTALSRSVGGIRVDVAWITASAATSIDGASGKFVLATASPRNLTELAADSSAIGAALLVGDPRFDRALRTELEAIRGALIPFSQLRPCARTIYVLSPFEEPPASAPGWLRRGLASQWSVQLCRSSSPDVVLSVMIADGPRDFRVDSDTVVVSSLRQRGGGNNWFISALPPAFTDGLMLTPEEAARTTFLATRTRLSSVPVPVYQWDDRLDDNRLASHVSWLVTLEKPVKVRSKVDGSLRSANDLIVQRRETTQLTADFFVAASTQPTQRWFAFLKDTTGNSTSIALDSVSVRVRGPHRFDAVEIVR